MYTSQRVSAVTLLNHYQKRSSLLMEIGVPRFLHSRFPSCCWIVSPKRSFFFTVNKKNQSSFGVSFSSFTSKSSELKYIVQQVVLNMELKVELFNYKYFHTSRSLSWWLNKSESWKPGNINFQSWHFCWEQIISTTFAASLRANKYSLCSN